MKVLEVRLNLSVGSVCFLGLLDPDPLVRVTDLDLDPFIINKNSKKKLDSYCFVTYF